MIKKADRVSQITLQRIKASVLQQVPQLDDTSKGAAVLGSTAIQSSEKKVEGQHTDQSFERAKSLTGLEGGNIPHVLSRTKASKQRSILSVKQQKRLV